MRRIVLLALVAAGPAAGQDGAEAFAARCAACHGDAGAGNPGLAPPLDNGALWSGLGEDAPRYLAGVVLGGLSGRIASGGQTYAGLVMPPMKQLADDEIALIGTHVLRELGQLDVEIDAGTVAGLRDDPPSHSDLLSLRPETE